MQDPVALSTIACAKVNGDGTVVFQRGFASVARDSAGVYTLTLANPSDKDQSLLTVSLADVLAAALGLQGVAAEHKSDTEIEVRAKSAEFVAVDNGSVVASDQPFWIKVERLLDL
jgi:hypothetical protein